MKAILVTGGAGYIGSHTVRQLAQEGYQPVTVDNLSEGHREAVPAGGFELGDLSDESFLDALFKNYRFQAVMHFASRCYVGESMADPRRYYQENLRNALSLFNVMLCHNVKKFILSSTCAVYGEPLRSPLDEGHPLNPVSPYGETKYFIERMLRHCDRAYGLRFVSLRYFNAAGASLDGRLGESHQPEPHLIPRVLCAAGGKQAAVPVYGTDYPTPDGTCVRDYIHVLDLASAHILACEWLLAGRPSEIFNLGTGAGQSVLQIVGAAREITGRDIPVEIAPRRPGDPPQLVADAKKAKKVLGWTPRYSDLETIIRTAWNWEQKRTY